jgi:3-isopropylmalate/(R)-2-methylmalate dehydratase small subunit
MSIQGSIWKYGDDVSTDLIFPGKYTYSIKEPSEMAAYALEILDPGFAKKVRPNDVIVAGKNWGCGSSREQAVTCLKECGISAIIAKSFGRIFFRNCLNAALPAIICPDVVDAVQDGDEIVIDLKNGKIYSGSRINKFSLLPDAIIGIFEAGGLIAYTRQRLHDLNKAKNKTI